MQRTVLALCLAIAFTNQIVNAIVFGEAPAETIQSLLAEARAAQSRGDFRSTAEAYRKATELEPSIPEPWANLGLMYHAIGEHAEAIQSFRQVIKLDSFLFAPQLFLGIDYLEIPKPDKAIPFLEKGAKLSRKDPQAERSLARAYGMKG
jgi:tetratricopeptide (TPR) repeat protein